MGFQIRIFSFSDQSKQIKKGNQTNLTKYWDEGSTWEQNEASSTPILSNQQPYEGYTLYDVNVTMGPDEYRATPSKAVVLWRREDQIIHCGLLSYDTQTLPVTGISDGPMVLIKNRLDEEYPPIDWTRTKNKWYQCTDDDRREILMIRLVKKQGSFSPSIHKNERNGEAYIYQVKTVKLLVRESH